MRRGQNRAGRTRREATPRVDPWLEGFRHRCDPLADDVIAELVGDPRFQRRHDLYEACVERAALGDGACHRFVTAAASVPAWVDFDRLGDGSAVFSRHGMLTLLVGFTVLVESYAGGRDNKVLVMSGRLSDKSAFRRMVETARFTLDVVTREGLRPGAPGHRGVLSVRLLHARVRRLCRTRGYDIARYDQPVNQEAMCGTLMLFSSGVIVALERFGVRLPARDKQAYHELWRYAGTLMGVDPALLPETYDHEVALFERLKAHQYLPDEDTRLLYEHAVRGVSRGARDLPRWLLALGGIALAHEPFLRQFTARAVDPMLGRFFAEPTTLPWRAGFAAARIAIGALSAVESRLPPLQRINEAVQAVFIRRLVDEFVGPKVRYEDPGFRRAPAQTAA